MSDLKVSLCWKNLESNTANTFRKLWNEKRLEDVTLATEDNYQIEAHKIILSSGSLFFQNIFKKNSHRNPLLYLKDINFNFFNKILEFLYTGQCQVEQEDLASFLSVGKCLRVIGLLGDLNNTEIYNQNEDNEGKATGNIEPNYEPNIKPLYNIGNIHEIYFSYSEVEGSIFYTISHFL